MSKACTEEQFLRDVAKHEMIVIRDDGLNRHIRFKQPDTRNMHFDLITWPGHLCYAGDMGTYVFQRLADMFEFFRTDRIHRKDPNKLHINLSYWTEKLIAINGGRHGGEIEEFSEEMFVRVINKYRVNWMRRAKESNTLNKDERRELWEAVDHDVLSYLHDGGDRALYAANEFQYKQPGKETRRHAWQFDDLFEHDFKDYKHGIIWCCYALAWGIKKYDEQKQASELKGEAA